MSEMQETQTQEVGERRVVMVAIDGSPQAESALDWYLDCCHKKNNDLLLLHVVEPPNLMLGNSIGFDVSTLYDEVMKEHRNIAKELVTKFERKLREKQVGGRVRTVCSHAIGDSIVQEAEKEHVDLIVTGTRGLGTVRRTIMGSVSDYVLHHVHCPVLIYRQD